MPYMVNGIGTTVCGSRGYVRWAKPEKGWWARNLQSSNYSSFDAVECFVFALLPLIPLKPVHTYNWNGNQYHKVPLRWSWSLVLRAYFRVWVWPLAIGGGIAAGLLGIWWIGWLVGAGLAAAAIWGVKRVDRRHRSIRWALGPHVAGGSDPASWTPELLKPWPGVLEQFKTSSHESAVKQALLEKRYGDAMWAARLCVVREDKAKGEALTDLVLADPGAATAIAAVAADPEQWMERLGVPKDAE